MTAPSPLQLILAAARANRISAASTTHSATRRATAARLEPARATARHDRATADRMVDVARRAANTGRRRSKAPAISAIESSTAAAQFETTCANPRATAAAIVAAGDRRRTGRGSALPVAAPPRGSLADQIIAAGKKRRGETA